SNIIRDSFVIGILFAVYQFINYWNIKRENQLIHMSNDLLDLMKVRDHFLAKVGHEIRTPLNGIMGFGHELLKKKHICEEANIILECAQDILNIVDKILEFSKCKMWTHIR